MTIDITQNKDENNYSNIPVIVLKSLKIYLAMAL